MTALDSQLRIGSLFSGYGGLDMGVQSVLGGDVAWHAEIEPAPSRVLQHHWPALPNHGDITRIDWASVEPVDILTGGFPCQDVSLAGLRRGLRPDTRSGLWSHYALAIAALRPSLVIVENVRGLLSAEAHSDLEPEAWDLGDRRTQPPLRALGAVLGDLADLGYDAQWTGVRAADAGAPHGRFRVFLVAYPNSSGQRPNLRDLRAGQPDPQRGATQDADIATRDQRRLAAPGQAESGRARADARRRGGASAADSNDHAAGTGLPDRHATDIRPESAQLSRSTADAPRNEPERWGDLRHLGGAAPEDEGQSAERKWVRDAASDRSPVAWGAYIDAIRRWERATGRVAPEPTSNGRLSPAFVEWMMGIPEGHVTRVGLTRSQQLKALGNGVVPQQAALALSMLLGLVTSATRTAE